LKDEDWSISPLNKEELRDEDWSISPLDKGGLRGVQVLNTILSFAKQI
jgi:hypothetical protein